MIDPYIGRAYEDAICAQTKMKIDEGMLFVCQPIGNGDEDNDVWYHLDSPHGQELIDAYHLQSEIDIRGKAIMKGSKETTKPKTSIVYDQFADAFLGFIYQFGKTEPTAVYDYKKTLRILVKNGMSKCDVEEYFEFNIAGGYLGETTPVFLNRCTLEYLGEMQ